MLLNEGDMSKPTPQFTMKELLEEVLGSDVNDLDLGEKMTTRDFMEALGLGSMKTARSRIRPLIERGVLVVTKIRRRNMAGFKSSVPAYAISPTATWDDVKDIIEGGGQ